MPGLWKGYLSGSGPEAEKNTARTAAAASFGIISTGKEIVMEQKSDAYSPDNLLRYHMALSFVDQLEAEVFLACGDKAAMYALIAEKFGIEKSSIFAI